MIDVRDDSYTQPSPCHACDRHLAGLDKDSCVRKCARIAAYRSGEPWEGREIMKMENKNERPTSNIERPTSNEKNNQQSTIINQQSKVCVICHDKDKKILNKRSETCGACYQRWVKGAVAHPTMGVFISSQPHIRSKAPKAPGGYKTCVIDGCGKVVKARGLCDLLSP